MVATIYWAISNIINYYKNNMKSIKSLKNRILIKSYIKYKGNFLKLNNIRNRIRDIRLIKLDKSGLLGTKRKIILRINFKLIV